MKVYILYTPAYAEHGCADWMVDTKFHAISKDKDIIEQLSEIISGSEIQEMELKE